MLYKAKVHMANVRIGSSYNATTCKDSSTSIRCVNQCFHGGTDKKCSDIGACMRIRKPELILTLPWIKVIDPINTAQTNFLGRTPV